jgi:hypothetical protein
MNQSNKYPECLEVTQITTVIGWGKEIEKKKTQQKKAHSLTFCDRHISVSI